MTEITALERRVVAIAEELGMVAELCYFVEYDPDIGRVPEHFRPRPEVMALIRRLYPPNTPNCQRPACDCTNICKAGMAEHAARLAAGWTPRESDGAMAPPASGVPGTFNDQPKEN